MKNERAVMIIYGFMKLINVFLGPFLTAYFIKISTESIVDISTFNILNYLFLAIFGIIAGYVVKKKNTIFVLRLGIITKFLCILFIFFLGERITTYYALVSFVYGFSSMFFYIPFNIVHAEVVDNKKRTAFELKLNTIKNIVSILGPILLGATITLINYQLTAIIILIFSLIQIIASFFLTPISIKHTEYHPLKTLKNLLKRSSYRKMLIVEYLNGLTFSDSVLGTVLTILIMLSFKTDFNLGIITSLTTLLSLFAIYLYSKFYKEKSDKKLLLVSGITIFLAMLILAVKIVPVTIISYNIIYGILGTGILFFIYILRLFNLAKDIGSDNKIEYWSINEFVLNIGRVSGFILLLIVSFIGLEYIVYFFIFLSIIVLIFSQILGSIEKN